MVDDLHSVSDADGYRPNVGIVLFNNAGQVLWARRSRHDGWQFPQGGIEHGETIEQAAVREVKEETGVDIERLEYHSSQPWPFPGSVMLGFHAAATSSEITLLDGELRDARWFSKSEVLAAKAKTGWLRLPSRLSIARRLVEDWCHSQ